MKRTKKRLLAPAEGQLDSTLISQLINFGPVTAPELESLGFRTLGDLRRSGWEEVCIKWVESYPERNNVNAFIGVIATLEGIVWTQVTSSHRAMARALVKKIKHDKML